MTYKLPSLSYAYDALEPYIDEKTMIIHHTKHHQAYIDNLNNALGQIDASSDAIVTHIDSLLKNIDKHSIVVRNNAGGHYNHSFFWEILSPNAKKSPDGELLVVLQSKYGSFENFISEFKKVSMSRFGSGWAWLILNNKGELSITSTPNQDNPLMNILPENEQGLPLIGLDLWEHAYYLKYQNMRTNYVDAFWNVLDWEKAEQSYIKNR